MLAFQREFSGQSKSSERDRSVDMRVMIQLACAGTGLTFGMEETFRPYIARAELMPLLEEFCPPFPGYYLYYPTRRNVPLKLRVLIDYLRQRRRET